MQTIDEFLSNFQGVKPCGVDSWLVHCPGHDDRQQSLRVTLRDNKILLHDHAGCDTNKVLSAIGKTMSDLFLEEKTIGDVAPSKRKTKPASRLIETYEFLTVDDRTVYCDRREPKSFAWWHEENGQKIWQLSEDTLIQIYRPDAVVKADTVYICEGVKDVQSLERLGFVATTAPHGGGAGKWKLYHIPPFAEKDVIICPDNDESGRDYAREIAEKLQGVARSVRFLLPWHLWPDLPVKGDITDVIAHLGATAGEAIKNAELLKSLDGTDAYEVAFHSVSGYCLESGCIAEIYTRRDGSEGTRRLCNFAALVDKECILDDGAETYTNFLVKGRTSGGKPLPDVMVPAGEFQTGAWIMRQWGVRAVPAPGVAAKDKLRHAIQLASLDTWKVERIFTCTGWRSIGGEWVYLHGGGSIPNGQAVVKLSNGLERYKLPDGIENAKDAIRASMMIFDAIRFDVAAPLMSAVYLAPLIDAAERAGERVTLLLYLMGQTGARKSTATALALSHYGIFTNDTLPASLRDTGNTLTEKAFLAKDNLFAIDDMMPPSSKRVGQSQNDAIQAVIKAMADGHSRGRMRSDGTLRPERRTRCLSLLTGEQLPSLGESDLARLFPIEMNTACVDIPTLSKVQQLAQDRVLSQAMRLYIEWLAPQMERLPRIVGERFRALRAEYQGTGHPRQAEALAWLRIGFEFMTDFWNTHGFSFDRTQEADAAFRAHAEKHTRTLSGSEPIDLFFTALFELIASNQAVFSKFANGRSNAQDLIGYEDSEYVYLLWGPTYAKIVRFFNDQGNAFPLTSMELRRRLFEAGYIYSNIARMERQKKIEGMPIWFCWIYRNRFDERRRGLVI